jgi:hypothetical protein
MRTARVGGRELGRQANRPKRGKEGRGRRLGRSDAGPRREGGGERGKQAMGAGGGGLTGWLGRARKPAQERRGFFFLFFYFLLLNAYFMETRQLHTREN